jgi:hypothetical protein
MVDQIGNEIPAAGITRGAYIQNDEILYSTVGFTQKGVKLAPGKGILLAGTVLARRTSTRLYEKWTNGAGDGIGSPVGVLRKTVETGSDVNGQAYMGNVVIAGILKLKAVSSANGGVSNLLTPMGAVANDVFGTFKF